jgi:hypothetical protein
MPSTLVIVILTALVPSLVASCIYIYATLISFVFLAYWSSKLFLFEFASNKSLMISFLASLKFEIIHIRSNGSCTRGTHKRCKNVACECLSEPYLLEKPPGQPKRYFLGLLGRSSVFPYV